MVKAESEKISAQANKFAENPFMKKTTVKLDQDKSKFISSNAKDESIKTENPFLKQMTG